MLPRVVIVGRPNVGKSSLFNALCGRRVAIVDDTPGVTRDRVSVEVTDFDRAFELVDTGGVGVVDREDLSERIEKQIQTAVRSADVVIFVVDARTGLHPYDEVVAELLRPLKVPVILAANKVDAPSLEPQAYEFAALGFGEPLFVSAQQRLGIGALLDAVAEILPPAQKPAEPELKVALVGRRNVGKSTFLNALAGEERVIVSEVPGTTRDAVDVKVTVDGRVVLVIDTAGLRKRRQIEGSVEFYSQSRTLGAVRRCDVALLLIDATSPIARLDKKLGGMIVQEAKPCVIVLNKWDLTRGTNATPEKYRQYLDRHLPGLIFAPIVCASALEGMNVVEALQTAFSLHEQAQRRIGTGDLNRKIADFLKAASPRRTGTKQGKVYFVTQADVTPPTFVFFVNDPEAFPQDYRRYLANRIREELGFPEVPLRLVFRKRESYRE